MGDTFGKFTSLIKYDYNKLFAWFYELEKLNYQSNYLPALSAYYFSQTPNKQDKLYTVYFLKQHALKNIEKKWWWLYQASYIANYGIGDKKLAIELATILKNLNLKNIPFWVKQTLNIFLSQWNDSCEAVRIISEIMNEIENNLSNKDKETELNYMKFFLNKELKKIEKYDNFDIKKCFNK